MNRPQGTRRARLRRLSVPAPLAGLIGCLLALTGGLLALAACSGGPPPGQRLLFVGLTQEIALGTAADEEVVATVGLYDDPELARYVQRVGEGLAATAERAGLPWTFRVLDDAAVDAYALPGGFVYVTRGLLAHLGSEAELAAVLAHEIGHVTAYDAVQVVSRFKPAPLGLAALAPALPRLADWPTVAVAGPGLLFLGHLPEDERQADDLALRYLVRAGYDPRLMPALFALLDGMGSVASPGRLPEWPAAHPDPGGRRHWVDEEIAAFIASGMKLDGARVASREYVGHLDGMPFGDDPRHGFVRQATLFHPALGLELALPEGWQTSHLRPSFAAASPKGEQAVFAERLAAPSPEAATEALFAREGVERGTTWRQAIAGEEGIWTRFAAPAGADVIAGTVVVFAHGGGVIELAAVGRGAHWTREPERLEELLAGVRPLADPAMAALRPRHLELVRLSQETTLEGFARDFPSVVTLGALARLNQVPLDGTMPAGWLAKRVLGPPAPDAPER